MVWDDGGPTLHDLLSSYARDYLPQVAPTTQYQTKNLYKFFRREFGNKLLTKVTPAFLALWRDSLIRRGYKLSTVDRYMDVLRVPFVKAVKPYGWLAENPFTLVAKPAVGERPMYVLTDDERERLLRACQRSSNPHLYAMVVVALGTGMRKNEVRCRRWRDIDLAEGYIRLATTKNKRPRNVSCAGMALAVLQQQHRIRHPSDDAYVFPRRDGRKPIEMDAAWRTARKRAELPELRFHDLRHTFASYLAMDGASAFHIKEILGHTDVSTTMIYVHLYGPHLRGVVGDMLGRYGMGGPQPPGVCETPGGAGIQVTPTQREHFLPGDYVTP